MFVNDRFYVWHIAIAYFYVVSIKNLVQLAMRWEMYVNQSRNVLAIFDTTDFAERLVKPDDIPFLPSTLYLVGACFLKFYW